MNKEQRFTDAALEKRIERGEVIVEELHRRAALIWKNTKDDLPP